MPRFTSPPTPPLYRLEVDLEGNFDFAGPNDDLTADVQYPIHYRRGRDRASQLRGRSTAGTLTARLKNLDGKYSVLNPLSPLYNKLHAGRMVQLRLKSYYWDVRRTATRPQYYFRMADTDATGMMEEMGEGFLASPEASYVGTPTFREPGALSGDDNFATAFDGASYATIDGPDWFEGWDLPYALSVWLRPTAIGTLQGIITEGDATTFRYRLVLRADGRLELGGAGGAVSGVLTEGDWYHVFALYDGSAYTLYVNGVLEAGPSAGIAATDVSDDLHIGDGFIGTLDEVTFWNIDYGPLPTAADAAALYGAGTLYTWPNHMLWQGYLDTIVPASELGGGHYAELRAYGALGALVTKKVHVQAATDITPGDALKRVFDDVRFPAGQSLVNRDWPLVDAGLTTFKVWFTKDQDPLIAARDIEASENGFLVETAEGAIAFEDRGHRLRGDHLTSRATFSDADGAELGYGPIVEADPLQEVTNLVRATIKQYVESAEEVLWSASAPIPLPPLYNNTSYDAPSLRLRGLFPGPNAPAQSVVAKSWVTPLVPGTDYVVNTAADGSGADLTGLVSVNATGAAGSITFDITGATTTVAYLIVLQARGIAYLATDDLQLERQRYDSGTQYGERALESAGPFLSSVDDALAYAAYVLDNFAAPVPVLSLRFNALYSDERLAQAVLRQVSDRITVEAAGRAGLGVSGDFFIEAIDVNIEEGGYSHWVTFELSPGPQLPANNQFAGALDERYQSARCVSQANDLASLEVGEPIDGDPDTSKTLWYRWLNSSAPTYYGFAVTSDVPMVVAVYTGASLGSLTLVASASGMNPTARFVAETGVDYWIQVGSITDAAGPFTLCWDAAYLAEPLDFSGGTRRAGVEITNHHDGTFSAVVKFPSYAPISVDDLLVAVGGCYYTVGGDPYGGKAKLASITASGYTFTERLVSDNHGQWIMGIQTAPVPSGFTNMNDPASLTFTLTYDGITGSEASLVPVFAILRVGGVDVSAPVVQALQGTDGPGGTGDVSLAFAPFTNSGNIGLVFTIPIATVSAGGFTAMPVPYAFPSAIAAPQAAAKRGLGGTSPSVSLHYIGTIGTVTNIICGLELKHV